MTTTLDAFLATRDLTHVWYAGVGNPTGTQLVVNLTPECEEDYCDIAAAAEFIPAGADGHDGEVTEDPDGEARWTWVGPALLRDNRGNSIQQLVVWAR